ncbi:BRISC and BRCA1-A complex member 1-like [Agrilus planipennis]|uniref:BRISC and BRCA1-A complex member 1 n=1 Tax=Agrilus planipennis TaxID=224129 RepID=A0A1W4X5A3_AGRPL|nr:BRISC and BRCA1-A complex member 1-like [Agrilus planipennis]
MGSRKDRIIPIVLEEADSVSEATRTLRSKTVQIPSSSNRETLVAQSQSIKEMKSQEESALDLRESLPSFNVPEKIIIAVDRVQDDNCSEFVTSGKSYSPLVMVKKAVEVFIHNKAILNSSHQFGLMGLNETNVDWIQDFTSSPQDIINSVNAMKECQTEDIFDLSSVFNMINRKIALNVAKSDVDDIPNFVVRLILIYGRSYTIPKLEKSEEIEKLLNCPYFTVDCVMTHEPVSSANNCDTIFRQLQQLDRKGFSYCFAVARNAFDLYVSMAKLLSHPLQRPPQDDAKYYLEKCTEV